MIAKTLLLLLVGLGAAGQKGVGPGDAAPAFELFGVDYRYHSLAQYADKKAVVVFFTCNHCPVAKKYEDTFIALAKKYRPKGVQFVAVNPNPADMVAADGFPQMRKRAAEKGYPFPYLYDETQKTARAYGAKVTPHVYVVRFADRGGKKPEPAVVYKGGVDNRGKEPRYLVDALDAVLAGTDIENEKTAAFGCGIKYRKKK